MREDREATRRKGVLDSFSLPGKLADCSSKEAEKSEIFIVEAYGGWGKGHPNSPDYWCTAHYWGQKDADGNELKAPSKLIAMAEHGRRTSWSEEFHTYGLYVDESYTIYYLDDEEVLRHPTNPVSYAHPHVLLVNYAIGGASGWKIDLERYGNRSNMYVDYIRVFQRTQP